MKATIAFVLLATLLAAGGCGRSNAAVKAGNRGADVSAQWSNDLFNFAIENLNHLEENDCQEMMTSTRERLGALEQPRLFPGVLPSNALLASWPEPDMLRQVVSRLNQWVDTQERPHPWTPDAMLAGLPPEYAKLPMVAELDQAHFSSYDGYMLMEAVWARDAARWAKGNTSDDLLAARNLFDWAVRNIQLDYDKPDRVPQVPWETLFLGHGTPLERAWTYIMLLRQCDIDAAIVALPTNATKSAKNDAKASAAELKPWCIAVLLGDRDKKLYLFDPRLGLPIPAANGIAAGKSGQLEIQPATLDQVVKDPRLLDRLARAADEPYWAGKADLAHAVILLEASPLYMEPRARRMEALLAGERKLVLSAEPSQQAARFKAAGVSDVRIWELPYATLEHRMAASPQIIIHRLENYLRFIALGGGSLYKGRILHLKGRFFDEKGAIAYYQRARPRTRDVLAEETKRAQACYTSLVAQTKAAGREVTPQVDNSLKQFATALIGSELKAILQGKLDAAYWLGLIEYEQEQYDSSLDYFNVRTLQAGGQEKTWEAGAHYNIGRCREMLGQWPEAVQEYESSLILRNEDGNLLRARWLKEIHPAKVAKPSPEKKAPEAKKAEEKKIEEKKATDKKP